MMRLYKYAFSTTGPNGPDNKALVQVGVTGQSFSHNISSLKDFRVRSYEFDKDSETTGVLFTESPLF